MEGRDMEKSTPSRHLESKQGIIDRSPKLGKPALWTGDYKYKGQTCYFDIYADSLEEAQERMEAIGKGKMKGQIEIEVHFVSPVSPSSVPMPILHMIGDILVRIVAFFKG